MTACTRAAAAVIQPEHDDDALLSPGETRQPPD
jgi:hypothetical protein